MEKLVMQEVAYHISTWLLARLHRKKKAPFPALPLLIKLYEIQNFTHVDTKMEEFKRFTFGTRSFNPYDSHFLVKDHCVRVYHPWTHGACHLPEEDPWRYYYNSSRLNELVRVVVEWLVVHKETTSQKETTSTTLEGSRFVHEKGKRKVAGNVEAE